MENPIKFDLEPDPCLDDVPLNEKPTSLLDDVVLEPNPDISPEILPWDKEYHFESEGKTTKKNIRRSNL